MLVAVNLVIADLLAIGASANSVTDGEALSRRHLLSASLGLIYNVVLRARLHNGLLNLLAASVLDLLGHHRFARNSNRVGSLDLPRYALGGVLLGELNLLRRSASTSRLAAAAALLANATALLLGATAGVLLRELSNWCNWDGNFNLVINSLSSHSGLCLVRSLLFHHSPCASLLNRLHNLLRARNSSLLGHLSIACHCLSLHHSPSLVGCVDFARRAKLLTGCCAAALRLLHLARLRLLHRALDLRHLCLLGATA